MSAPCRPAFVNGALSAHPRARFRRAQRALVCASAVVTAVGRPATEHMVYDLSTGGVRLCGLPLARIGDPVILRLQLPEERVVARGQLLRVGSTAGAPDFAVEFLDVFPEVEDVIHDAVVDALSDPERRSVLLLRDETETGLHGRQWPGWSWLDPISSICGSARTPLEALQWLAKHGTRMGIVSAANQVAARCWAVTHPEIPWPVAGPEPSGPCLI